MVRTVGAAALAALLAVARVHAAHALRGEGIVDSDGSYITRVLAGGLENEMPGSVVLGDFEKDTDGWRTECADQWERVEAGVKGAPPARAGGKGMLRFRSNGFLCSSINYTLPAGRLRQGVTYHLLAWIWIPEYYCTTDFGSINCPYTKFQSDFNEDGAGVLATAVPNRWNAITGDVWTTTGTDVTVMIKQLPEGIDVFIDDVILTDCSIENFRTYAMPRIDALHKRDVTINVGAGAAGHATVQQTRHEFPFGATTTIGELDGHPGLRDFFVRHFNAVTDEYNQKWEFQETANGQWNWGPGDGVYKFAVDNNLHHRGHDIFAEGGAPDWLFNLPVDGSENSVQAAIWDRLNKYLDRYDAQTINYDVVNEITHFKKIITLLPCQNGQGCMCQYKPACEGMGYDANIPWWTWAYHTTRKLLEKKGSGWKRLMQNDFCTGHYCGPHNSPSTMVKETLLVGNDAYGMQMHQGLAQKNCGFNIHMRVQESSAVTPGTAWWFTEFDVDDPDINKRADGYEMGYLAAYSHPQVEGMTLWGWAKETIAPDQDGRPYTSLVTSINDMTLNAAGERVLGENGILMKTFRSTAGSDIPAEGDQLQLRLFKGDYTITLGDCTANFQVLSRSPATDQQLKWNCGGNKALEARALTLNVVDPNPPAKPEDKGDDKATAKPTKAGTIVGGGGAGGDDTTGVEDGTTGGGDGTTNVNAKADGTKKDSKAGEDAAAVNAAPGQRQFASVAAVAMAAMAFAAEL